MAKMIQIRNVPDELHKQLKALAAEQNMSLSDFVKLPLVHMAPAAAADVVFRRSGHPDPSLGTANDVVAIIRSARGG